MLSQYTARLNQMKGKHQTIIADLEKKEKTKEELTEKVIFLEEARLITQLISENNQNKLTAKINDVTTTAIQTVFGDDFTFQMNISTKNNTVQASLTFYNRGKEEDPKVSQGGGMLAIASLALRVVLMTLLKNPQPIILLDEPFTALGPEAGGLERGCRLLKTISNKLDIQFLITTHGAEIKEIANRVFHVSMKEKDTAKVITKDNVPEIIQEDL